MKPDQFSVLVVCTGNVNRSALGAALLQVWADWYLPGSVVRKVHVSSAGLGAPVGRPMGRRSRAIAAALGADGSTHAARQITDDQIRAADLVLVSSDQQREAVLGMVPGALRSTFTIREAGRIADALPDRPPAPATAEELRARVAALAGHRNGVKGDDDDIVDPQGKEDDAYREMARQEVPPLARLARLLFGMPPGEIAAYDAAVDAGVYAFDGESGDSAAGAETRVRRWRKA